MYLTKIYVGYGQSTLDSTQTEGESTDFTELEGAEATQQAASGVEEECSDDEMIFEAYVFPFDVIENQDDLHLLGGEDTKVSHIGVVPLKMANAAYS